MIIEQQNLTQVWTVDLSSEAKIEKFKSDRAFSITNRLSPYLPEDQQHDLCISIEEIKSLYENKVNEALKFNSSWVSLTQAKYIFRYVEKTLRNMFDSNEIECNIQLQSEIAKEVSRILKVNDEDKGVSSLSDNSKNKDITQNIHSNFNSKLQNDIEWFLKEAKILKQKMKGSKEDIISKVNQVIANLAHIKSSEIFGSYQTNLDLPWSDIDFVVSS